MDQNCDRRVIFCNLLDHPFGCYYNKPRGPTRVRTGVARFATSADDVIGWTLRLIRLVGPKTLVPSFFAEMGARLPRWT